MHQIGVSLHCVLARGAVYCNRSYLFVNGCVCVCGSVTMITKLRASIFTKLGL